MMGQMPPIDHDGQQYYYDGQDGDQQQMIGDHGMDMDMGGEEDGMAQQQEQPPMDGGMAQAEQEQPPADEPAAQQAPPEEA